MDSDGKQPDPAGFLGRLVAGVAVYSALYVAFKVIAFVGTAGAVASTDDIHSQLLVLVWVLTPCYVAFVGVMLLFFVYGRRILDTEGTAWLGAVCVMAIVVAWLTPHTMLVFQEPGFQAPRARPPGWPPALVNLFGEGWGPAWAWPYLVLSYHLPRELRAFAIYLGTYGPLVWTWLFWFDRGKGFRRIGGLVIGLLVLHPLSAFLTYGTLYEIRMAHGWLASEGSGMFPRGHALLESENLVATFATCDYGRYLLVVIFNGPYAQLNGFVLGGGLGSYLLGAGMVRRICRWRAKDTPEEPGS